MVDNPMHKAEPLYWPGGETQKAAYYQGWDHGAAHQQRAVALTSADCSALICEHGTRLSLDPSAAATIARAVQARIMELSDVR